MKLQMKRQAGYNFRDYMAKDFDQDFEDFVNGVDKELKKTRIEYLDFTKRVANCLKAEGITTMERLETLYNEKMGDDGATVLNRIPNFGRKSNDEVREALEDWRGGLNNEYYSWNE